MANYYIALSNIFVETDAPLVFNVGYYNQKTVAYNCISKLSQSNFVVYDLNNELIKINNNTFQASNEKSYSVLVYDLTSHDTVPIKFDFYVFQQNFIINQDILLRTINRELPNIYQSSNLLNNADNEGAAAILFKVYQYIYTLFYNALTSIGVGNSYNLQWETVYIGATNFLKNAVYPAQFLKTLMNINSQTSTQVFSISIAISRLVYQFTGITTPVQMQYLSLSNKYLINIYYLGFSGWILGVTGHSELGVTTILSDSASNPFLWIIEEVIIRIMPAYVKFEIQYLDPALFDANFNVSDVSANDYINPATKYDAYKVVNNNNVFNTQGFLLNP